MANAPKPTTVKKESSSTASNLFATLVIPICLLIGVALFIFVLGKPTNFNIPADVAKALGTAVGKPTLPWVEFSDEEAFSGMVGAGLPEEIAKNYVEMGDAIRSKKLFVDYYKNRPVLGSIKLEDFARDFAAAYHS